MFSFTSCKIFSRVVLWRWLNHWNHNGNVDFINKNCQEILSWKCLLLLLFFFNIRCQTWVIFTAVKTKAVFYTWAVFVFLFDVKWIKVLVVHKENYWNEHLISQKWHYLYLPSADSQPNIATLYWSCLILSYVRCLVWRSRQTSLTSASKAEKCWYSEDSRLPHSTRKQACSDESVEPNESIKSALKQVSRLLGFLKLIFLCSLALWSVRLFLC